MRIFEVSFLDATNKVKIVVFSRWDAAVKTTIKSHVVIYLRLFSDRTLQLKTVGLSKWSSS